MILSYHSNCKCGHPLSWHMWMPEFSGEWPLAQCSVAECGCREFVITFWTWLTYTLFRKVRDSKDGVLQKYRKWYKEKVSW